ncbi:hypothetical protein AVEN_255023-1 [Araneus ventricosus]|uniref:THAP-type domain-containing protein n=1 Tax=Araneus ventricosus TaxID=182803 RepID=A0A4Y2Q618_ARAVE|nr:hypothetical protein AVEN_255023-1 [Araneus ventricosus]
MSCKCSVPACRGNYDESNKVAVFSFPNDERLRAKWLHAIPRKDFNITKNSKVCEKHFKDGEVLRNSTFYNEKTGETISAPMKRPKLKENVVPSIIPGCPSYMSSSSAIRESPSKKRQRLEQEQIDLAVKESLNNVIHIVPIDTFDASKLFDLMKKVILSLEEIGFKVMGMVTDNNSINRAAASNFANPPKLQVKYDHPADKSRPLFYVIDSVHILKCVRNNCLNNHKNGYYFYYPDFDTLNVSTASLSSVRKLYDLECSSLLKFGYGLTSKALWPTNLERQNVKLELKLFSTDVMHALNELGEKYNLECYEQTAKFIDIISTWWDIVNVKTPDKGKFKCNPMCEPLTSSPSDKGLMFLKQLVSWVNKWENLDSIKGRLSKETFLATLTCHTTQVFIEIVNHCTKSFKKEYILLGKIQADKLESRFRQYRSMAGDQYHIYVRQIYETESKLRLCQELKLASHKKGSITVDIFDNREKNYEEKQPIDLIFCDIMVEESDIEKIADTLPIVTYLAGYCSHAALKKTKCLYCRQKLRTDKGSISHDKYKLIDVKDRGGLLYPSKIVVNAVIHTYIVVQKLISEKYEDKFIQVLNQCSLVVNLIENVLVTKDIFLSFDIQRDQNWGTFVQNRVREIRSLTSAIVWRHVPGALNAADLVSRGCSGEQLLQGKWWEGPSWFSENEESWPKSEDDPDEDLVSSEKRKTIVTTFTKSDENVDWYYKYFSSVRKIVHMPAWIFRFYNKLRKIASDFSKTLSVLEKAEIALMLLIQKESFKDVNDDKLKKLRPIIGCNGLIRAKTNISNRDDTNDFKFPIILPSDHTVVKLLIMNAHNDLLHAGTSMLMSHLREKY